MRARPNDPGDATEHDYARAATDALDRGDHALALEQIGAALSFDPRSPDHLAALEAILRKARRPLALLPDRGEAFFGAAALRAFLLAREGERGAAVTMLLEVVAFRPAVPYLVWCDRWTDGSVRGIPLEAVLSGVAKVLRRLDEDDDAHDAEGARLNLAAALRLLDKLADARPAARSELVVLQSMLLRRLGDLERARALVDRARSARDTDALRLELAAIHRAMGELDVACAMLERAAAEAPRDATRRLDLGDVLLALGRVVEARARYDEALALDLDPRQRADAEVRRAHAVLLAGPLERSAWTELEALASTHAHARALVDALASLDDVLRLPDDPVAEVIRNVVDRCGREPSSASVRLRVRVERPPPRSAYLAFDAALAALGRDASLLATVGEDEPLEPPRSSRAAPVELVRRIASLAVEPITLDTWCVGEGAALSIEEASPLLDVALPPEACADPIERLQRMRLATLSLVARRTPESPSVPAWLAELARGADAWLAVAAIAVLGALAKQSPSSTEATRHLVDLAASNFDDARRAPLARIFGKLPRGVHETPRRANGARAFT